MSVLLPWHWHCCHLYDRYYSHLTEQTGTDTSSMVCNHLQLPGQSATVFTVCYNFDRTVTALQSLTVWTVCNSQDILQLSEYAIVCAVSALVIIIFQHIHFIFTFIAYWKIFYTTFFCRLFIFLQIH